MPTCLASPSGLLRTSARPHSLHTRKSLPCAARKVAGCRRIGRAALSTAAAGLPAKYEDERKHTLTVLHKTAALLPRILPHLRSGPDGVSLHESLQFWEGVLGQVYEDLSSLTPEQKEKGRVRVAGACYLEPYRKARC